MENSEELRDEEFLGAQAAQGSRSLRGSTLTTSVTYTFSKRTLFSK